MLLPAAGREDLVEERAILRLSAVAGERRRLALEVRGDVDGVGRGERAVGRRPREVVWRRVAEQALGGVRRAALGVVVGERRAGEGPRGEERGRAMVGVLAPGPLRPERDDRVGAGLADRLDDVGGEDLGRGVLEPAVAVAQQPRPVVADRPDRGVPLAGPLGRELRAGPAPRRPAVPEAGIAAGERQERGAVPGRAEAQRGAGDERFVVGVGVDEEDRADAPERTVQGAWTTRTTGGSRRCSIASPRATTG